jgi:hypothetical protein
VFRSVCKAAKSCRAKAVVSSVLDRILEAGRSVKRKRRPGHEVWGTRRGLRRTLIASRAAWHVQALTPSINTLVVLWIRIPYHFQSYVYC